MTKRRCLKIIEDLQKFNAVILVVWHAGCTYPRLWLKEWCGVRSSVSIGTAEMIRDAILAGKLFPADVVMRPVYRKLHPAAVETYVETVFVR